MLVPLETVYVCVHTMKNVEATERCAPVLWKGMMSVCSRCAANEKLGKHLQFYVDLAAVSVMEPVVQNKKLPAKGNFFNPNLICWKKIIRSLGQGGQRSRAYTYNV